LRTKGSGDNDNCPNKNNKNNNSKENTTTTINPTFASILPPTNEVLSIGVIPLLQQCPAEARNNQLMNRQIIRSMSHNARKKDMKVEEDNAVKVLVILDYSILY
jgi:hypothetical protein